MLCYSRQSRKPNNNLKKASWAVIWLNINLVFYSGCAGISLLQHLSLKQTSFCSSVNGCCGITTLRYLLVTTYTNKNLLASIPEHSAGISLTDIWLLISLCPYLLKVI